MLVTKTIGKYLAGIVLLTTLLSFNTYIHTDNSSQPTQTELVSSDHSFGDYEEDGYHTLKPYTRKVTSNRYAIFSFKSLLRACDFSFNIHFKTQKEMVLKFNTLQSLTDQNLIANLLSIDAPHILIK